MNKLVIFIGTLQSGGAERVVSEISTMYCDHFNEVIIVTWYDTQVFYKIDSRIRLVCVQKEQKGNSLKKVIWLRKFVCKERPDVFLSFLMPFNMLAIASLLFTKTKVVVCERRDPSVVKNSLLRAIRNILYHFCLRIQVQTCSGKEYFSKALQRKVSVISNPNHITKEERDYAMGILKENRIVSVGRLIKEKNYPLLIESFSEIAQLYPKYRLDIYGDGGLIDDLQSKISGFGICDKATLCGRSQDIPRAISSAKIFVLSSDVEGMPNALMEAMAVGLPCIATDVSGVRDIITDGENGFIVPVGDKKSMVGCIKMLIESDDLRDKFSKNTISVFEKFDKDKIFRQWLELVSF